MLLFVRVRSFLLIFLSFHSFFLLSILRSQPETVVCVHVLTWLFHLTSLVPSVWWALGPPLSAFCLLTGDSGASWAGQSSCALALNQMVLCGGCCPVCC